MKKLYPKNSRFILRLCLVVLLAAVSVIYSCRKDLLKADAATALSPTDPKLAKAKNWYEAAYPKAAKIAPSHNINATGATGFDWSQALTPDWNNSVNYTRYDDDVIEMPLGQAGKLEMKDSSINSTQNYSRSSFLLLKQGETYHAYIMTVIGEPDYINGDVSRLANNRYNKRDANFSGVVYYTTPQGKFVNGWHYKKGVRDGHLTQKGAETTGVNLNSGKRNQLVSVQFCYTITASISYYNPTTGVTYLWVENSLNCYNLEIPQGGDGNSGGGGATGGPLPDPCAGFAGHSTSTDSKRIQGYNPDTEPITGPTGDGFPPPVVTIIDCYEVAPPMPGPPANITNNVTDLCLKTAVSNAISKGLNSYTSDLANHIFGDNAYFDLNFTQISTLSNSVDGITNCQGVPSTQGYFIADISLNSNTLPMASKEYVAATIVHEILHAYWTYNGKLGEFNQHTEMAESYITTMTRDLTQQFPGISNDDATALSWGGLDETQAWKNMVIDNPLKADSIVKINKQYKDATGTKGQRCP